MNTFANTTKPMLLAHYYLERLRHIHEMIHHIGDHLLDALDLLTEEWAQIKQWYLWASHHALEVSEAAYLCGQFLQAGENLFDFVLSLREQHEWQSFGLEISRKWRDRRAECFQLLALARLSEKLDLYFEGTTYARQALILAEHLGNSAWIAQSNYLLGILCKHKAEYGPGAAHLEHSLRIFQRQEYSFGIATCLSALGDIASLRGDYLEALRYYQQTLALVRQQGYRRGIADSLRALGTIYYFNGDYELADIHNAEALTLLQQMHDKWGAAEVMYGLGVRTFGQQDIETAYQYAEQSLQVAREIGSLRGIARSLLNLGLLESVRAQYEAACRCCTESTEIYRNIGNTLGVAHSLTFLAYGFLGIKSLDDASSALAQALDITLTIDVRWLIPMILGGVSYLYCLYGEYERSAVLYGLANSCPVIRADVKQYGLPTLLNTELVRVMDATILAGAIERGRRLVPLATFQTVIRDLKMRAHRISAV